MSELTPSLRVENIVKTFPGVQALDRVSISVTSGEVHALMGENGAGKSTLMKILGGLYQPDSGNIYMENTKVEMKSPLEAKKNGIIFIHQELSLAEELSVAENIYLGELPRKKFGIVDWKELNQKTDLILKKLKVGFEAKSNVGKLSIANRQMVEIARALTMDAKLVIFDEPTASLTDAEKTVLFDVINDLKTQGVGIIYISHRMEEIFKVADRISVLRDGQYRITLDASQTDEDEITQYMIGRKLDTSLQISKVGVGEVAIEVENFSCGSLFNEVNFKLHYGEVLGFYGLIGAGRTEIAETIFGLREPTSGKIRISGVEKRVDSPAEAIANGISLLPEDRKLQGLVLGMNCRENLTLPQVNRFTTGPFISESSENSVFNQYVDRLDIRTTGWKQIVNNLSGGNQQKIVMGKWLAMNPRILIVDEPTRGIDVGSKSEIHNLIHELADQGYAVMMISSEMQEILGVCNRIVAMYSGRIIRTFSADEITESSLMQAISGINP